MADDPQVPRDPDHAFAAVLLRAASKAVLPADAAVPNAPDAESLLFMNMP